MERDCQDMASFGFHNVNCSICCLSFLERLCDQLDTCSHRASSFVLCHDRSNIPVHVSGLQTQQCDQCPCSSAMDGHICRCHLTYRHWQYKLGRTHCHSSLRTYRFRNYPWQEQDCCIFIYLRNPCDLCLSGCLLHCRHIPDDNHHCFHDNSCSSRMLKDNDEFNRRRRSSHQRPGSSHRQSASLVFRIARCSFRCGEIHRIKGLSTS